MACILLLVIVFYCKKVNPVFSMISFSLLQYMVPFLLNQCGSVVFYLTLASAGKGICYLGVRLTHKQHLPVPNIFHPR